MEDTEENLSPKELQLRSSLNQIKKRMKEMEELFVAEDEKSYQEIQQLHQEKKELEEKIENLQSRIFNAENFSPSLLSPRRHSYSSADFILFTPFRRPSSHPSSPAELKHNTSVVDDKSFNNTSLPSINKSFSVDPTFDDSLLEDYANLQDDFQILSDQKAQLEEKVVKLNEQIKALQEITEDLRLKENGREEHIQKLESAYDELCQNNQDLYKTVCQLQKEINDLKCCNKLNESQISLFEELEEIKQKEFDESMLPEIVVIERNKESSSNIPENENEHQIVKNKRTSFMKRSLFRLISALSICFDYLSIGVKHEFPIVYFFSSDIVTLQARPRVPQT